jgi:hypothetical protein
LLIGGGTVDGRASREIRRVSRLDPAAHNALRVDGQTYAKLSNHDPAAIRIDGVWEQPHWSAVRILDGTFERAALARTVIHLKPGHALIVVDELSAHGGDAQFEQFWHFAPSLQPRPGPGGSMVLGCEGGVFNAAFDTHAKTTFVQGGAGAIGWTSPRSRTVAANPYIVRERRATTALMATFFQWSPAARAFEIDTEGDFGNWSAIVSTKGAAIRYTFGVGELRLVE